MAGLSPSLLAIELVKQFEGFRAASYIDVAGYSTIGYGHRTYGEPAAKITEEQALELLKNDLAACAAVVNNAVYVKLEQSQFDALCSLVFNIGPGHFLESTLRKRLNLSDYRGAADQFLVWDKVHGTVVHGLVRRRLAEQKLFMESLHG